MKTPGISRIVPILLSVVSLGAIRTACADVLFAGGDGSETSPYLIETAEQLRQLVDEESLWDKDFRLIADIDLGAGDENNFAPIGQAGKPFRGVFDGAGHSIRNLRYIYGSPTLLPAGFFKIVEGPRAKLQDLVLENATIHTPYALPVGLLAGSAEDVIISNCTVRRGNVTGQDEVGGLVGRLSCGTITNCQVHADIYATDQMLGSAGGIAGDADETTVIHRCSASGNIRGAIRLGGIAGRLAGLVRWSAFDGLITATDTGGQAGGVVGSLLESGRVEECQASGEVRGGNDIGGIAGVSEGYVRTCRFQGTVDSEEGRTLGGLVGRLVAGSLEYGAAEDGVVQGHYQVGGAVGENAGGRMRRVISAGQTVDGTGDYVGGLVGRNRATVEFCESTATTAGSGKVGGLTGDSSGTVRYSSATGQVVGELFNTGGLIGTASGEVLECCSRARVEGGFYVGGLIGTASNVHVENCYAAQPVQGGSIGTGGLIGKSSGSTVIGSYWDEELSGQSSSAGGEPRSTAQMQQPGTYVDWNFDIVWRMGGLSGYPELRWDGIPGDLGGGPGVDLEDVVILGSVWMQSDCGGPLDCGGADLNGSGAVDMADLAVMAANWLTVLE